SAPPPCSSRLPIVGANGGCAMMDNSRERRVDALQLYLGEQSAAFSAAAMEYRRRSAACQAELDRLMLEVRAAWVGVAKAREQLIEMGEEPMDLITDEGMARIADEVFAKKS